ncbi:hypothetical protein Dimus_015952 [Dionaea muscipula]
MASTLSMSNFANRDSLLGPKIKPVDAVSRTSDPVNQGIVGLRASSYESSFGNTLVQVVQQLLCCATAAIVVYCPAVVCRVLWLYPRWRGAALV